MTYSFRITYWQFINIYVRGRVRAAGSVRAPDPLVVFLFHPKARLPWAMKDILAKKKKKKRSAELLALHIPVSFNSFAHGMRGEECLATQ